MWNRSRSWWTAFLLTVLPISTRPGPIPVVRTPSGRLWWSGTPVKPFSWPRKTRHGSSAKAGKRLSDSLKRRYGRRARAILTSTCYTTLEKAAPASLTFSTCGTSFRRKSGRGSSGMWDSPSTPGRRNWSRFCPRTRKWNSCNCK